MGDNALQELQQKLVQQTNMLKQVTQQSRIAETTAKRSDLTLRELQSFDESVNCYESVGRAYFLRPKSSVEAALQETQASCRRQQEELAKKKELVMADLKAAESEVKELVQNHPEVAQRFLER